MKIIKINVKRIVARTLAIIFMLTLIYFIFVEPIKNTFDKRGFNWETVIGIIGGYTILIIGGITLVKVSKWMFKNI